MTKTELDKARTRFAIPSRPVEERKADGKSLRAKVPHEAHAEYRPGRRRRDPVAMLEEQAKTRIPSLIPIRYARMLASPFAFLRGSAAVMAADLAASPVTDIMVQACGDMHVANFGVFASAERNLVFGINDFDETLRAPWEWDLKRLAASAVVACRFMGADSQLCEEAARAVARTYRKRMREYAEMGNLEVWYARIGEEDVLESLTREARLVAERVIAMARQRGHVQVLAKMAELVDSRHRIVESKPLIVRETHTRDGRPIKEALSETLNTYYESLATDRRFLLARYRVVDAARKVVGVGSVGTRCWVILMSGNHADDPLFLQYKEAQSSVLAPYTKSSYRWANQGERIVAGQRLIQGAPDIFLGWGKSGQTNFYIRQLRDMKGGAEFDPNNVALFPEYCKLCGWALALAHAKSGDPALIAGYLGKSEGMDEAITRFAVAYADQTERDYDALAQAAKAKRIRVARAGV